MTLTLKHRAPILFRALSDPTRIRILHLLKGGELCVCDLMEILRVPQAKTSRHLAYLRKAGLVTARFLIKSFKYAFLLIFVAAAVITPTGDMVTQTIFAAPMVGLYLLSIGIAWFFGKTRLIPDDESVE